MLFVLGTRFQGGHKEGIGTFDVEIPSDSGFYQL